jgi:drug/metabolite transporter (DMT)-like permease
LLFVVGMFDLFAPEPVPHELAAAAAPESIWRVYGLYLAIGSGLVLAAIFGRFKPWARRVERMGMMLLAGATGSLSLVLWEWMQTGAPSRDDTDNVVVAYLLILLVLTAVGSLARFFALRNPKPLQLR